MYMLVSETFQLYFDAVMQMWNFLFFQCIKAPKEAPFFNCRFNLMIYCLKIYVSSLMVIWSHQTLSTMTLMSRQSNCTLELPDAAHSTS